MTEINLGSHIRGLKRFNNMFTSLDGAEMANIAPTATPQEDSGGPNRHGIGAEDATRTGCMGANMPKPF